MIIRYLDPLERLEFEIIQLQEEGRDVSKLRIDYKALLKLPETLVRQGAMSLLEKLMTHKDYISEICVDEPDELDAIRNAAAQGSPTQPSHAQLNGEQLYDRILGGWLGRSAGCLLGKPIERYPRLVLREMLESNGNWPLDNYWTQHGMPVDILKKYPWKRRGGLASLRENIQYMPEDDDLNYTMLNLHVFETSAENFQSEDVASAWLAMLPVNELFTAERVAYFNILSGLDAPESATYINPFREWIGAQIRADFWGYVSPGNPQQATEFAWRDARISHSRNGIYGEMFFAAFIASAFYETDIRSLVNSSLTYVPVNSRFAEAINIILALPLKDMDWEQVLDKLHQHFGHYHWVHTINNAALTVAALLFGEGNFEETICNVVMGGWDTDSNGATAGSILGVIKGAEELPPKWIKPLNNCIGSSLKGFDNTKLSDLAKRTTAVINNLKSSNPASALDQTDDF